MRLRADSASGYRVAAVATLAAAVAGITMLGGIVQLQAIRLTTRPLITAETVPAGGWPQQWLSSARTAQSQQNAAVAEWLNIVLVLVLAIVTMAAISALIGLFAHATARRYETALRAVVGAPRSGIRREQLGKAAANAGIAVAAGVSVGLLGALVANRTWPHERLGVVAAEWVLVSCVFATAVAALVARTAAARMAKAGWLGDALAPESRANPGYGAEDLRNALLHLQFAVTFALLTSALLVGQQAGDQRAVSGRADDARYVTRVTTDEHVSPQQRSRVQQVLNERGHAIASPGALIGVGPSDHILSDCGPCTMNMMYTPMFALRTQQHVVSEGFFGAVGGLMKYGREFERTDMGAHRVVVNDTFARLAFQGQHPIGRSILVGGLNGQWYTVIGVVHDLPITGLIGFQPDNETLVTSNVPGREAAVYFNAAERPPAVFDVVSIAPIDPQLAGLSIGAPKVLRDVRAAARAPAGWLAGVLTTLAVTAALMAGLSLAALTLLNVRQRRLEIATRRSVGARRREIMRLVIGDTLRTAARGGSAGLIASAALARALQMVLPQMRIFDIRIVLITAIVLLAAAVAAAWLPARAAGRVMPAHIHV